MTNKIYNIQFLRFFAAILVVLYHLEPIPGSFYELTYHYIFRSGHVGVDIFFVISGYIIFSTIEKYKGIKGSIVFVLKRFFRIFPLYLLATITISFIKNDFGNFFKSTLFIPIDYNFPLVHGFPTIFVGWTLNYEIMFYLATAIIFIIFKRSNSIKSIITIASILALIQVYFGYSPITEPILYIIDKEDNHISYLQLVSNPIVYEFLMGGVIFNIVKSNIIINKKFDLYFLIISVIAISLTLLSSAKMNPWSTGLSSAFLVYIAINLELNNRVISDKISRFGNLSYCIYLAHPILMHLFGIFGVSKYSIFEVTIFILILFNLSLLIYYLIEIRLNILSNLIIGKLK